MVFFFAGQLTLMMVMSSSVVTNNVSYEVPPPADFATTSAEPPPSSATSWWGHSTIVWHHPMMWSLEAFIHLILPYWQSPAYLVWGVPGSLSGLFEESIDLQFDLIARVFLQRHQFALCLLKMLHFRTHHRRHWGVEHQTGASGPDQTGTVGDTKSKLQPIREQTMGLGQHEERKLVKQGGD